MSGVRDECRADGYPSRRLDIPANSGGGEFFRSMSTSARFAVRSSVALAVASVNSSMRQNGFVEKLD